MKVEQFEDAVFEKNDWKVQYWFLKMVWKGYNKRVRADPMLGDVSVTHASLVASVGPVDSIPAYPAVR